MTSAQRRVLDIGLMGLLLLIGAVVVRTWRSEDPAVVEKVREQPVRRESPPEPAPPEPLTEVDLLALVDVARDAVKGSWGRDGKTLITASVPFGRLMIPYVPPEEYEIRIVVTRSRGTDSLNIGLVGGGRPFVAILDGTEGGDRSGLDIIDNKGFMENPTTHRGRLLYPGATASVRVSVRRDRVTLRVNDQAVIEWEAAFPKVRLIDEWKVPRADALFVGSYATEFRIDEMVLTPLRAGGRKLR